jgi:hypothetical protein
MWILGLVKSKVDDTETLVELSGLLGWPALSMFVLLDMKGMSSAS